MKTKKELKDRLSKIKEEIQSLRNKHWKNKEYMSLIRKAEEIKEKIQKETDETIDKLQKEKYILEDELKNLEDKKFNLSPYLNTWLNQYKRGIDWGYTKPFISWHSNDERFVVLTHHGGTSGQGTAMGSMGYYYAPTTHTLIDTKRPTNGLHSNKLGFELKGDMEGRLTKEKLNSLLSKLEEYKIKENIK